MEVTQRIQSVQDVSFQLFKDIEGRGEEMEQVVTSVEQFLEGSVNEAVLREFTEKEALVQQQVKVG
jgi:hypothetical protein